VLLPTPIYPYMISLANCFVQFLPVQVQVMYVVPCCAILVLPDAVVHQFFDVLLDTIIKDDLYVVLSSVVTCSYYCLCW
jgi:hypothetical protein